MKETYKNFKSMVGLEAIGRLERYTALADSYHPEAPPFQIGVLGVHLEFHGRGFGGHLMEVVHALSDAHPGSIGVAVETETAGNVPFYEHYGYVVVVKMELDSMDVWNMFWEDQKWEI